MPGRPKQHISEIMSMGGRPPNSMRKIEVIDTTFRDGQQSLWATRMRTSHMLSMLDDISQAGFSQVDLVAPIQFDVSVRYLKEDPWERVRILHEKAPSTKFRALIRSRNIASFDFLPDDVINAWVEQLYANGFRVIGSFDGLNDIDNIAPGLRRAKELGAQTFGALSYCESPVHTDELYIAKTKEYLEKTDIDAFMLKDAGGLLTPERIRTLVPAIKDLIGDRPLEIHSHCLTALAPLVYLEAVEHGVDVLHLSIAPLANANGQPAVQSVVRDLKALGYEVDLDMARIAKVSDRLHQIAEDEGKPLGAPVEYNGLHYMHQIPGGMLSNFRSQLKTAGLEDRFDELLVEVAKVRSELAYPIMITPFAQFVGTQAVLNVITGERYKIVPNEIKKYVLGYYGKLLAPIDPELRERIIRNGASEIAAEPGPIPPMLPDLAARYPDDDIDTLLLRAMFAGTQVDEMVKAKKDVSPDDGDSSLLGLIKRAHAQNSGKRALAIKTANFELKLGVEKVNANG